MEQSTMSGFICTQGERLIRKYIVPFVFLILITFSCLLWTEVFVHKTSLLHWIMAIIWSIFIVGLLLSHYKMRDIDEMRFWIENNCVINSCNKTTISVNFDTTVFLSKVSLEFAYGKATQMKDFYLLSNKPFNPDCISGGGLFVIKHLFACKIVTIPNTRETAVWIEQRFNLSIVPSYPKITCICTTGGRRDGLREP